MKAYIFLTMWAALGGSGGAADLFDRDLPSATVVAQAAATERSDSSARARPPIQNPLPREFEPPPVPEFMLRKPAKPLTLEEMKRQADEAAEKARRARAAGAPASSVSGEDAATRGDSAR